MNNLFSYKQIAIGKFAKYLMQLSMASILFILFACDNDDNNSPVDNDTTSSRVILAYIAGENDLSVDAKADLDEMLKGSIYMSNNDTLVVMYDNANKSQLPCIYEITKGMEGKGVNELTPFYTFDRILRNS